MGRGKEPAPPVYTDTEIKYGDKVIGRTYFDRAAGKYVNQYYVDPEEEQRKLILQNKANQLISGLGATDAETAKQFDDIEKAYVDDAAKKFNETYTPALTSLREDVASRFGTLNSSQFLSGLDDLERTRSSALVDIINRGKAVKSDLYNQQEANKLNELKTFTGILSTDQQNLLDSLQNQIDTSGHINDFNNNQWVEQLNAYKADRDSKRRFLASIVGSVSKFMSSGK